MKFLWIFDADAVATLIPLVSVLWAWGGSGPKFFRRLGVPAAICLGALSLGVVWWKIILTAISMFAFMSIPYGSGLQKKVPEFLYFPLVGIVGGLYAASLFPLAFGSGHWFPFLFLTLASGISFGVLTLTSQKLDWPKWKYVEMVLGALIGATAAAIL